MAFGFQTEFNVTVAISAGLPWSFGSKNLRNDIPDGCPKTLQVHVAQPTGYGDGTKRSAWSGHGCLPLASGQVARGARQSDLHPYGGVYSMASALYNIRTGGDSKGWFFVRFSNHVEAVDLSPHNWSWQERQGKTIAVDDDALAILYRFRQLRSLNLRDTQVTDGGVRHIASLKRLEQLDIRGTRITDDGLQELQGVLPHCEITR